MIVFREWRVKVEERSAVLLKAVSGLTVKNAIARKVENSPGNTFPEPEFA
jgi:hypothetical protein